MLQTTNANLEEHRRVSEKFLHSYCVRNGIPELLGKACNWAIVGGAIRDCLLSENLETFVGHPWKDLDIAVIAPPEDRLRIISEALDRGASVRENTFQGLAITHPEIGQIDLWWINNSSWKSYMQSIDFGLNAALFSWNCGRIWYEDRFRLDLKRWQISRTARFLPKRHIQPIRAIALAVKLEQRFNKRVQLHLRVRHDLRWLVQEATDDSINIAARYAYDKISAGRWPSEVLDRLLVESRLERGNRLIEQLEECTPHI